MKRISVISLIAVALLCSLGLSAAAPSTQNGRIVGGHESSIAQHPYQVSVRLDTYILLHICGGTIYAPKVIVTAAHCIKGRFASYIRIVAGSTTIADESDPGVQASKLIPHAGYNKNTHENDVGLIILAKALEYSEFIKPIPLSTQYPTAGSKAIVTGWGKKEENAETLTQLLQEVEVEIVDLKECAQKYTATKYAVVDQMLCAGVEAGGKDACQGDSGGPLVVDGELVGIVSWGNGCAKSDFPGVYASVSYHMHWILETSSQYL